LEELCIQKYPKKLVAIANSESTSSGDIRNWIVSESLPASLMPPKSPVLPTSCLFIGGMFNSMIIPLRKLLSYYAALSNPLILDMFGHELIFSMEYRGLGQA